MVLPTVFESIYWEEFQNCSYSETQRITLLYPRKLRVITQKSYMKVSQKSGIPQLIQNWTSLVLKPFDTYCFGDPSF